MKKKTKTNKKLSILIKYLRPYKKTVAILALFAIAEHAVYLIAPTLFGKIVDIVIQEKVFSKSIMALLAAWIILDLLANWFMRIKNKGAGNIAYKVSQDLVLSSVDHLVRLPLEFHRNKKTGEIIQRISRADEQLYGIVEEGLFYIIPNVLTSVLAFCFILWIDWQLAIAYLIFIGLYIIATVKKTGPIIRYQHRLNHAIERIYGSILDRVPNIFNVKSNTAETLEHKRYHRDFAIGNHYNYHQVKLWTDLSLWQSWVSAISFVTLFGIGIYFVQLGKITVGQFVMLLTYINMVALLLSTLADYYKRFQEGMVAIARSEEIFKVKTEDYDNPNALPLERCKGHIKFTRVHFSYPEKNNVLDGISFEAKAGQMIAIVGRSGQGKSTITNLISRYFIPSSGRITLDGIDISRIKLGELRSNIAIVPQEVDLFNDTISNNIRYSSVHASKTEIMRAAKLAHCHEFIMKLPYKYEQMIGDNGAKLSTGQKQRIAIARAILRNPKILILDEATSALDSESEYNIQKALEDVMKGRTTFVIAHRLSTIRKADLILVLEKGKIVERGDHQELMEHGGVYKKLTALQKITV